ncbi:MAG: hypothetical protein IKX68_04850 [Clostridiales bacterium]|nr:hypothetical protein [Clostridiales bacterium]
MKLNVKKFACVALSFSMIASLAACSKKDDKEKGGDDEATGCIAATETLMDAVVSLNAKKIKKLEKELGVDGDALSDLETIADEEFVAAVMEKASYEIDEDSLKEKKKTASVNVTVSMPDYEDAYDEAGDDIDDFKDALDSQKEKKYKTVDLTVKFDVEDEEYTLSNFDEICEDLFNDMLMTLPSGLMVHPTQTEPTDDTEPTDTTAAQPTDTDPTDTTPAATDDTTSTTTAGAKGSLRAVTGKKVDFNQGVFEAAVANADADAAKGIMFSNQATQIQGYTVNTTGMAFSNSGVIYTYYEFDSEASAQAYADTCMTGIESIATSYEKGNGYNFCMYMYGDMSIVVYQSGACMTTVLASENTEEICDQVSSFAEGIFK